VLRSLRKHGKQKHTTIMEDHFRIKILTATIDQQLYGLNSRFSEQATELLISSGSSSPKDGHGSFKVDDICILNEKCYPKDFSEQEMIFLKYELQHCELHVLKHQM